MTGAVDIVTPRSGVLDPTAALGANTLVRHLHVLGRGSSAEVSTLLYPGSHQPPSWIKEVIDEVREDDEDRIILLATYVRVAQAVAPLPPSTPKPYVGVGDDGTIGLEWDLPQFHVEIQIGNDDSDDAALIEADGQVLLEEPLAVSIYALAVAFRLAAPTTSR